MTTKYTAPSGAPCWIDLFTTDMDTCLEFYSQLFGWTYQRGGEEFSGYTNFFSGEDVVAGCMGHDSGDGMPNLWSVYLSTPDAAGTTATATANGASVIVPPMPVGDLGHMAVLADNGGAGIGLWQPGAHPGFTRIAETGAPAWFELHTRDYDAALEFYKAVFGWDVHVAADEEGFRYSTLGKEDDAKAGVIDASGFLPEGVPSHWVVYFAVADVDAALARVTELGGATVMPGENTPYGRLAQASDPSGAMFKLMGPNNPE